VVAGGDYSRRGNGSFKNKKKKKEREFDSQ